MRIKDKNSKTIKFDIFPSFFKVFCWIFFRLFCAHLKKKRNTCGVLMLFLKLNIVKNATCFGPEIYNRFKIEREQPVDEKNCYFCSDCFILWLLCLYSNLYFDLIEQRLKDSTQLEFFKKFLSFEWMIKSVERKKKFKIFFQTPCRHYYLTKQPTFLQFQIFMFLFFMTYFILSLFDIYILCVRRKYIDFV